MNTIDKLRRILPITMGFTARQAYNFCRKLQPENPHIFWTAAQHENGSGMFAFNGKSLHANRVVFAAFNPDIDITGRFVTQSCGISCCVAPGCLKLLDKRPPPGSKVHNLDGIEEVAATVGTSQARILNVMRRLSWKDIDHDT